MNRKVDGGPSPVAVLKSIQIMKEKVGALS